MSNSPHFYSHPEPSAAGGLPSAAELQRLRGLLAAAEETIRANAAQLAKAEREVEVWRRAAVREAQRARAGGHEVDRVRKQRDDYRALYERMINLCITLAERQGGSEAEVTSPMLYLIQLQPGGRLVVR